MTGLYENIFAIQNASLLTLKFAAITKGYALAFQAFGSLYWDYVRHVQTSPHKAK